MLIALLTDIHANRQALEACLDDAEAQHAERYVFLGDIVGYGGDPVFAVDVVADYASMGAIVLRGNHDAAIEEGAGGMNGVAARAIEWTRAQLDPEQRAFLAGLPLQAAEADRLYVHADGSEPADWNYVTSAQEAERSMAGTTARLTFCGHVHRPQLYGMAPGRSAAAFAVAMERGMPLAPPRRWLAVMGSVGQPRNRDPAASYALFDDATSVLTYRRVPYDIDGAARRIEEAGLPAALGHRLFVGL